MVLKDKIAVVTGAAQGLGEAVCRRLAQEGCHVVAADLKLPELEAACQRTTAATGRTIVPVKTDVSQEADVAALFDKAVAQFGKVDICISNAAILIAEPIDTANAEKWRAVMNVNLFGNFLAFKHAARIMKPRKSGVILQVNSKSGKKGSKSNSAYAASKFGGIGLVQSVALELADHGIRVNAVCPGNLLDSPLWSNPDNGLFAQYLRAGKVPGAKTVEDVRKFYQDQVPMKRGCTYEDICNLLVFLSSDQASYMTGQAINVTGGQEMR
jgi:sorbitol-6-phosphate 2-dehydrogenase